jgi:hypothetical protein
MRTRAQANHRDERWHLNFLQYERLWGDLWTRRGRGSDNLIMMREDWHRGWTPRNTIIADRSHYSWQLVQIKLEKGSIQNSRCEPGTIWRRGRDVI